MLIAPLDGHVLDSPIQYPNPRAAGLYRLSSFILSPSVLYSHRWVLPRVTRHEAVNAEAEFTCTDDSTSSRVQLFKVSVLFEVQGGQPQHRWGQLI